jgi:hypothetical protein
MTKPCSRITNGLRVNFPVSVHEMIVALAEWFTKISASASIAVEPARIDSTPWMQPMNPVMMAMKANAAR